MRVIAGSYKGRRLICPKGDAIRPTTDKVKEALFGALQFELPGAHVLDAFAGSGALGIEALSRGAEHADFVELSGEHINAIKQNLMPVPEESYTVFRGDVLKLMPRLNKYDIVLLDPPYDAGVYTAFLETADSAGILRGGSKVVMECRRAFDFILPPKYNLAKKKDYGDISLWFLEYGE
jgi:16S rRNA (guanine966-N2)-methyltransferase